jgi:hypothetical protein
MRIGSTLLMRKGSMIVFMRTSPGTGAAGRHRTPLPDAGRDGRVGPRYHRWRRIGHAVLALLAAAALPAAAGPLPPSLPPALPPARHLVWLSGPPTHEAIGLPVIEPMLLLEAFAQLSPVVGGPIAFELRRPHPEMGGRQVASASDVLGVAERLDQAGLGLADLTAIECRGPACRIRFEVDTRRLDVAGSDSVLAWALPIMDRLLATSPLSVTVAPQGPGTRLTVVNRGADAWLLADVRIGDGRSQRLSRPVAGQLRAVPEGWTIVPAANQVAAESVYEGLVPPGRTRHFDLDLPLPPGPSCPVSIVAYRLSDPSVLGGIFLRRPGRQAFEPAAPPWDQWQPSPLLMLGNWPPALVIVRQCDTAGRQAAGPEPR